MIVVRHCGFECDGQVVLGCGSLSRAWDLMAHEGMGDSRRGLGEEDWYGYD